jgi:phospholipase/carboxylesterase
VPGAEALWLLEEGGHNRAEAFMRGNEFAHVHPPYDGSLHMMLLQDFVTEVIEQGWGEAHPLVPRGEAPPTLLMVFGPRHEDELKVVLQLVDASGSHEVSE